MRRKSKCLVYTWRELPLPVQTDTFIHEEAISFRFDLGCLEIEPKDLEIKAILTSSWKLIVKWSSFFHKDHFWKEEEIGSYRTTNVCTAVRQSTKNLPHLFCYYALMKNFSGFKKAFCQIQLTESDANKHFFLWLKNIFVNDFSLKAYKNTKLTFGLKCSPTILLAALFNLLVIDVDKDNEKNLLVKELFQNEMIFTQCILRHYELFKDPQEKSLNITISSSHQFRSRIVYLLLRKWLTSTRQILCQRRALNQANHHNPFFIPYL